MNRIDLIIERDNIKKWFTENDWKINKVFIGEWALTDERWISYLNERQLKRNRLDEIEVILLEQTRK